MADLEPPLDGYLHAEGFEPADSMTSVQKLESALADLADVQGSDAGQRMLLNTLKAMLPALRKLGYIPDDPAELDTVLLKCAAWALSMRSDDAWQPEDIVELYMPEPRPEQLPDPDPPPAA
jgi:hypothetical protein